MKTYEVIDRSGAAVSTRPLASLSAAYSLAGSLSAVLGARLLVRDSDGRIRGAVRAPEIERN